MPTAKPRVLLSSVFQPFTVDDNQVTRAHGPFSLRMHHRSWGLMLIQHNIQAPTTLLDFPTRARFVEELESGSYDVVGISGTIAHLGKVRELCRLVRRHSPHSVLVVGGHVTGIPDVERLLDADHIVTGDGVRWFRGFLGEPVDAPIRHPAVPSSFGALATTIIPSVGCPMGDHFSTTSQLFDAMRGVEQRLRVRTFFMMDESFLLDRKRAMELLGLMRWYGKPWSLYVFSSANALRQYSMRELVELGISWVWLEGADTIALTRELQSHGIRVQDSTIVGLEHHSPENLPAEIDHVVRTTFAGWRRYANDSDPRVRSRFAQEIDGLRRSYGAALWAMERHLAGRSDIGRRIGDLRRQIEREFGAWSRVFNSICGRVLLWSARRAATRYSAGRPLEPRTFVERTNWV
jgi:hypothetical protein